MTDDDFLQIFKTGFHKLKLTGVRRVAEHENKQGRRYFEFQGRFVFVPPKQIWHEFDNVDCDFLYDLLQDFAEETSNCIIRKFTKKVIRDDKVIGKRVFRYVFDVIPKNVVSFSFDIDNKTMTLLVRGWGLFQ